MDVQELIGSKKAKVTLDRSNKFRRAAGRTSVGEYLDKFGAKVSNLGEDVNLTNGKENWIENFEFILNNIRNSVSLEDRERFISKAKEAIINFKKSYDRILSDVNLSTEDRNDIKNTRNALALEMDTRLDDVINGFNEETIQTEQEISTMNNFELPEVEFKVEARGEENNMGLENDVRDSLVNMQTYKDYIYGEIMKRKGADFDNFIGLVIDYFVNGTKIIGVYTLEEFVDERRKQIEKAEQRKIEDQNRKLERECIDSENQLKVSSEKIDMLSRQRNEYREKADSLRDDNNSLTQRVSEQKHTISELERANSELNDRVKLGNRNIDEQQRQIFELQRKLDNAAAKRSEDELIISDLKEKLSESMRRERAAEDRINDLNESTIKWRDKISFELKKLSPSYDAKNSASDGSDENVNGQSDIDLDKLSKGFEELSRVMNSVDDFGDSENSLMLDGVSRKL